MDARYAITLLATVGATLAVSSAHAQDSLTVAGRVMLADSIPLGGANVFLLETLEGDLTDAAGRFTIRTTHRGAATLVVRQLGYREQRLSITVPPAAPILVTLGRHAIVLAPITVEAGRIVQTDEPDAELTPLTVVTTPGTQADVFRAIQTFPGLQIVDEGAGLFVRGGDVSETRVFLNDATVLSPYRYESPTGGFFGAFDPFQLGGIYFSTGGFGARYGDALSGVAALETRGRPQQRALSTTVSLAGVSGDLSLAVNDRLGLQATANRTHARYLFAVNGRTSEFTAYPEGRDLSGGLVFNYRKNGEVKLYGLDQWNQVGVVVDEPSYSGAFEAEEGHRFYVARWRDVAGPWTPTLAVAAAGSSRRQSFGAFRLDTEEALVQVRGHTSVQLARGWSATVGGEVERRTSRFAGSVPDDGYDVRPDARQVVVASTVRGIRQAVFVESDWLPWDDARLTVGLRSDRSTLTERRTLDPRVSAAWRVAPAVTLTAAWGRYHQVPAPLFYDNAVGEVALGPMRAEHWIAGAQVEDLGFLLRVEGFIKTYRDLVQWTRDFAVADGGRGVSRGVDTFLRWSPLSGSELRVAYSFIRARRTDPDTDREARSPFDITHVVTIVGDRTFANRWRISASYRFATGRPFTPVESAAFDSMAGVWVPTFAEPMSERGPRFQRVDLAASYLQRFWNGNLTAFFVGLTNVFDRTNVFGYSYSADYSERTPVRSQFKRSVYFGVSMTW